MWETTGKEHNLTIVVGDAWDKETKGNSRTQTKLRQAEQTEAIESSRALSLVVSKGEGPDYSVGPTVYATVAVDGVTTDALEATGSLPMMEIALKVLWQNRPTPDFYFAGEKEYFQQFPDENRHTATIGFPCAEQGWRWRNQRDQWRTFLVARGLCPWDHNETNTEENQRSRPGQILCVKETLVQDLNPV